MKLYIGNKNYSSWSLRAWLLLRQADIPFEEIRLRFDFEADSAFRRALAPLTPAGKVPVLVDDGFSVWETPAIAEYVAEAFPEKQLWPADRRARARARSLCAEMHAGFADLRNHCPMNVEASFPDIGARLMREHPGVVRDVARLASMWGEALAASGGPLLSGGFGVADAFFAPVCVRLRNFAIPVPPEAEAYIDRVLALPAMQEWTAAALAEHDFVQDDEPYRTQA